MSAFQTGHLGAIVITDSVRNVSDPHKDVKQRYIAMGSAPAIP